MILSWLNYHMVTLIACAEWRSQTKMFGVADDTRSYIVFSTMFMSFELSSGDFV